MTKKAEAFEAAKYFYVHGFLDELTSDKKHYVEALIKYFAEKENIDLV